MKQIFKTIESVLEGVLKKFLYASGTTYILVATMLYAPGTLMYLYHRKKMNKKMFENRTDFTICLVLMAAFVMAIILTMNGTIQPF